MLRRKLSIRSLAANGKFWRFLLDISVGGDDQPVRILDRPEPQAVLHDTDQKRQLAMFAKGITEIMSRAAPVFEIMRSAAKLEPEIADLLQHMLEERLQNMTLFVGSVTANGPLRDGLDEASRGSCLGNDQPRTIPFIDLGSRLVKRKICTVADRCTYKAYYCPDDLQVYLSKS